MDQILTHNLCVRQKPQKQTGYFFCAVHLAAAFLNAALWSVSPAAFSALISFCMKTLYAESFFVDPPVCFLTAVALVLVVDEVFFAAMGDVLQYGHISNLSIGTHTSAPPPFLMLPPVNDQCFL